MKTKKLLRPTLMAVAASISLMAFGGAANAGAIISNGTITMGINDQGHLNVAGGAPSSGTGTTVVGLRYNATGSEATAPGCLCEGWGAGIVSLGTSGFANVAIDGVQNLSLVSFSSTASTATSVVAIGTALEITHFYHPTASTSNLYQVDVSIKNLTGQNLATGDLRYRRVMDWDIEPTAFSETVTVGGVPAALGIANGSNLRRVGDDGFSTANPLNDSSLTIICPANTNFTDCGPTDHGALFDFEFGALAAGATTSFTTYYGAAGNEADADAARLAVGAGLYSYGQTSRDPVTGTPNTFIFGFGASNGVFVPPTDVPEPISLGLFGIGLAGLGFARRRKSM